eukprot:3941894-Rhodomonas_salina.5
MGAPRWNWICPDHRMDEMRGQDTGSQTFHDDEHHVTLHLDCPAVWVDSSLRAEDSQTRRKGPILLVSLPANLKKVPGPVTGTVAVRDRDNDMAPEGGSSKSCADKEYVQSQYGDFNKDML